MSSRTALFRAGAAVAILLGAFGLVWVVFVARGTSFGPAIHDPKDFLITLLNGLTLAGLYFVVASGFTLIFGLMRVVNMAHGAFFLLGGYIALKLQRHWVGEGGGFGLDERPGQHANWVVPPLIAACIVGVVGLTMQQVSPALEPGPGARQALITIAIAIILADQMLAHFGGVAEDIAWPGSSTRSGTCAWRASSTPSTASSSSESRSQWVGCSDLAEEDAHRHGHPGRRRRPPDGERPRHQHPADLRDRVLHRLVRSPVSAA